MTTLCQFCIHFFQNKEGDNKSYHPLYGVEKVTTLEPYDKKILAKMDDNCNIYRKLVLFLKLDTQTYYNLRMILGLECKS